MQHLHYVGLHCVRPFSINALEDCFCESALQKTFRSLKMHWKIVFTNVCNARALQVP